MQNKDAKQELDLPVTASAPTRNRLSRARLCLVLVLLLAQALLVFRPSSWSGNVTGFMAQFMSARPADAPIGKFVEVDCSHDFKINNTAFSCFRMAAPLDHTNTSDPRRASIAIATYPAGGGQTDRESVLGTIFLNPGGPGGSGLQFLTSVSPARGNVTTAEYFDKILKGRYDVASFDPRAVGYSYPHSKCYDDAETAYANEVFYEGAGLPHSSDHAIVKAIAYDNLMSNLCERNLGEALRYVSTPSVVKDLVLMHRAVGDDKLNFAGFSYGTVLGSYFADIYPELVGKFWLDGVVDVPDYQQGLWSNNLVSFEDVLNGFFTTCAEAREDCPLATLLSPEQARSVDKGASVLRRLYFDLLDTLKEHPVPVINATLPSLATYTSLKTALFSVTYAPSRWPAFASQLTKALQGDWVPFVDNSGLKKFSKGDFESSRSVAMPSIACGDGLTYGLNWTKKEYKQAMTQMEGLSPFAAEIWIGDGARCLSSWKIRGKDVWRGNFNATPASPILFGSNTYDPVTPLLAARKMQDSFGGGKNRLLHVKDGYGHCTIASRSTCGLQTVTDWFVHDELPQEKEKICSVDRAPYLKPASLAITDHEQAADGLADIWSEWQSRR